MTTRDTLLSIAGASVLLVSGACSAPPVDHGEQVVSRSVPARIATPAVGDVLVAARGLADPNFERSVVLLLRCGPEGTIGVIVNRPLPFRPVELLPDVEGLDRYEDQLYEGGPVGLENISVLVYSRRAVEGTREIVDGVRHGSTSDVLERLAGDRRKRRRFRLYAGHAGWAPGQLEREIEQGGWVLVNGDREIVFTENPSELWNDLVPAAPQDWVRRRSAASSA
jgi:putative transcriptional regulator